MNKFLLLFSLMFMACSTVDTSLKAETFREYFKKHIAETANSVSKEVLTYTVKAAKFLLKEVSEFLIYPIPHGYYFLNNVKKAVCEKSGVHVFEAMFDLLDLTLWVAAAILTVHGSAVAVKYLADYGIVGVQTVAGFQIVDKYISLNSYFQYILGVYGKIPKLTRCFLSCLACGTPCAVVSILG